MAGAYFSERQREPKKGWFRKPSWVPSPGADDPMELFFNRMWPDGQWRLESMLLEHRTALVSLGSRATDTTIDRRTITLESAAGDRSDTKYGLGKVGMVHRVRGENSFSTYYNYRGNENDGDLRVRPSRANIRKIRKDIDNLRSMVPRGSASEAMLAALSPTP